MPQPVGAPAPLRSLQVINSIAREKGGMARFMVGYCGALAEAGVDVSLITGDYPGLTQLPLHPDIDLTELPTTDERTLKTLLSDRPFRKAVREHIARTGTQVAHVHGLWIMPPHDAVQAVRKAGVPLVMSVHGMLEDWSINFRKRKKQVSWHLYQRRDLEAADALQACSDQEAEAMRRRGLTAPIAVIPIGVEGPDDAPAQPEAVAAPKERRIALFLSRVHPKKGLPMLLRAWAKLEPQDWELVIAGNDNENHQAELEALAEELGIRGEVVFAGPQFGPAKDTLYRRADLFVLPTHSENFGIVVPEALSYRVPVLTTTGAPWGELPGAGCGWSVEPTQEGIDGGLAAALSTSDADLAAMGEAGRTLVDTKYRWSAVGARGDRFYRWLAGEGARPDWVRD